MVLGGQPPGRVGRRRITFERPRESGAFLFDAEGVPAEQTAVAGAGKVAEDGGIWINRRMELKGEGVVLRAWRMEDAPAVAEACQDPEIARWLAFVPQPYNSDDARRYIQECIETSGDRRPFAITDAETAALIGSIDMRITRLGAGHIGYWMAPAGPRPRADDRSTPSSEPVGDRGARSRPRRARNRSGQHRVAARGREGGLPTGGSPTRDAPDPGRHEAGRRDVLAPPRRARLGGA